MTVGQIKPSKVMERNLSKLKDRNFDLLVVGGGIFGSCAALDAVQRGLSVAIIDKDDFCSASSAHSYKLVHGGIRYLQHGDLSRIRQSSAARRALLRIAPHLVYPQPMVVPTYGYGMKSKWAMRAAMALYDVITFDRNRGISDPAREIPRGMCLSRDEVLERYPGLRREGLTGAAVFCDGQMYNPPRLVLAFVKSAVKEGAVAANYVEATQFLSQNGRVCGVEARDGRSGDTFAIRAETVLNASGPYAEPLLRRSLGVTLTPPTHWSRDAYFIVDRPLIEGQQALALQAQTIDSDAILDRGGRHLFLTPWRDHTLVGVWHKVYEGPPDHYQVSEDELQTFLDEVNSAYADLNLTLDDVSLCVAGLIPFGESEADGKKLSFGHHSRLIDHAREHGIGGLITLIGVRFTTGPVEAVPAVDLVFRELGKRAPASRLQETPLVGGDIDNFEALVRQAATNAPDGLGERVIRALVHNYGTEHRRILGLIEREPELGTQIGSSTVLEAEVVHAVRNEMAQTLADVVLRRTDLGTGGYPGRRALEVCARRMARELGWNRQKIQREIDEVIDHYPERIRQREGSGQRSSPLKLDWSLG